MKKISPLWKPEIKKFTPDPKLSIAYLSGKNPSIFSKAEFHSKHSELSWVSVVQAIAHTSSTH